MTDKQIIIDANQCEWRTGVEHCGDYECMLNKCCDYNCDWYKRRKLEQQLKLKEQECEKIKNWVKGMMFYTDCSNWFERFTTAFDDWKNDLTSQLDQLKAEVKSKTEYIQRKEQECEQKEKDIKYLIKCLDNSFKTQQDSELHWEKERKKLKTEKQQAEQKLEKIKEFATALCYSAMTDGVVILQKDILKIIDEVE